MHPPRFLPTALLALAFAGSPALVSAADVETTTPAGSALADYAAGRAAIEVKQWKRASDHLRKAVERDAKNADAWNLLGFTQRKLGEFDAAGVAYDTALTINPAHLGALEYQGELFLQTGAVDRAKDNLETLRGLCGDCEEFGDLQAALKAAGQS